MGKTDGSEGPSPKRDTSGKNDGGEMAHRKLTFVECLLSGPEISDEMAEIINQRAKKPSREALFGE